MPDRNEKHHSYLLQGCEGEAMRNLQAELENYQTQVQSLQEQLVKERSTLRAFEAQAQHIELDDQVSCQVTPEEMCK